MCGRSSPANYLTTILVVFDRACGSLVWSPVALDKVHILKAGVVALAVLD